MQFLPTGEGPIHLRRTRLGGCLGNQVLLCSPETPDGITNAWNFYFLCFILIHVLFWHSTVCRLPLVFSLRMRCCLRSLCLFVGRDFAKY
jgi:hypothetical protein